MSFALAFTRFLRRHGSVGLAPLPVIGREHLEAARASGRGVIVLSAHLGDWESGAAAIAAEGVPIHLAARPQATQSVERMFAERRWAGGVGVLPVTSAFASMATVLRRREWVALMADRGAGMGGGASICAWAAVLAQRTGALVLPVVCVRDARGDLALHVEPPLTPERCRDGAFRETLLSWLARWPEQWAAFESLPEGLA